MNKTVVILLSDKRSGSTMFQEALCAHPKIQTVSYSPHTYLETHHWLKASVILNKDKALYSNSKIYKGYGGKNNAKIYLKDELLGNLPDFNFPKEDKDLIFNGWEALCEKYSQPIFFEKSPQYLAEWASLTLLLDWIQQTKFNVKIIGLVRNPLSVQYSAFKLFRTNPKQRQFDWLNTYRNLITFNQFINDENYMLVRYEDIVENTQKTLEVICDFIGIKYCDVMVNQVHGNSKTKWNQDPFFTLQLDSAVVQLAKFFGYTDFDLTNKLTRKLKFKDKIIWSMNTLGIRFKSALFYKCILPLKLKLKNLNLK